MQPGDTVHHSLKTKEHDDWTGIVLCVETHTETGTKTGRVGVRWISPTGAPNDGWNWHWPFELVLAKASPAIAVEALEKIEGAKGMPVSYLQSLARTALERIAKSS